MPASADLVASKNEKRFRSYARYKDSWIDWLGKIPTHWKIKRVEGCAKLINGFPFDSEHFSLSGGAPLVRIRDLYQAETEINYDGPVPADAWIATEDLIIGMDGAFNVARWRGPNALLNQRLCSLRPRDGVDPSYFFYVVAFPLTVINDLTHSTTVKHLSSVDVRKILVPVPPISEQRSVAAFLDRETATIDALIAKKERLIGLLEERRAAVITKAVTKGLDPNVPMKPSGIEWLGEIPAHWKALPIRRVANSVKTGGTPAENAFSVDGLPWYTPVCFGDGISISDAEKHITRSEVVAEGLTIFPVASVLVVGIGTLGKVGICYMDCTANQQINGIVCNDHIDPRYVAYALHALPDVLLAHSVAATLPILNQSRLKEVALGVPRREEQRVIVAFLDKKAQQIGTLVSNVRKGIEQLRNYRASLISAAVTGKIDVREEVAA